MKATCVAKRKTQTRLDRFALVLTVCQNSLVVIFLYVIIQYINI